MHFLVDKHIVGLLVISLELTLLSNEWDSVLPIFTEQSSCKRNYELAVEGDLT